MNSIECKTCRYFAPHNGKDAASSLKFGECRYNPPVVMALGDQRDGMTNETMWPTPYVGRVAPVCRKHATEEDFQAGLVAP